MRTIRVTQEHIDKGIRNDVCLCPVALALKSAGICEPYVTGDEIEVGSASYSPPEKVTNFIFKFDAGESVRPFKFSVPNRLFEVSR